MSLSAFLKENTVQEEFLEFVVSDRFQKKNEDGEMEPVKWKIKSISTTEEEKIKKSCTKQKKVGKGVYTPETDIQEYLGKLAAACTVHPNLKSSELQDSYNVLGADKLLKEMLKPGEYAKYVGKVQEFNGFDIDMDDLVDEAKN